MKLARLVVAVAATAAFAALSGCASKPAFEKPKFDAPPHTAYLDKGTSTIRGQVLLRNRGETPLPCNQAPMVATPATQYFRQVIRLAAKGQMPLAGNDVDPDYRSIVHTGQCDANGNFVFDGLAAGDWYVVAQVNWAAVNDSSLLYYKLRLRKDMTVQIVMTDRDVGTP